MGRGLRRENDGGRSQWIQTTMRKSRGMREKRRLHVIFVGVGAMLLIERDPNVEAYLGRKLRCNGEKPSCYNCTVRRFECEYVPVQRRRGPGKAPKGSRTKKGGRTESRTRGSEQELDSLAPEVRPFMSVLSFTIP